MYGLPITREFEMNDRHDVINTVRNFNQCPLHKRYILATNIKKAFNEFNITQPVPVEESNSIVHFLNNDFIEVVTNVVDEHKEELSEIELLEFKSQIFNKINDIISDNDIVTESIEVINHNDKINKYFIENDIQKLVSRMNHLKQYGLINDLDETDILTIIHNIPKDQDIHLPKVENELGNLVCINDNLYIICKQKNITNEYLLLPADTLDLKTSVKIIVENSNENNITMKSLINKYKK